MLTPFATTQNSFENKHVIVTGSSRGIGEATVRLCVERGARKVVMSGLNEERGETIAPELEARGCEVVYVKGDLADVDVCRSIIKEAEAAFGTIHTLINAAGVTTRGSIFDTSVELWDYQMAVNARAPFILTQGAVANMRRHGTPGTIANILSITAHGGPPFLNPYSSAKGALMTFTKNTAYAVMRHRIRVNGLMLGWTNTPTEDEVQRRYHTDGKDWLEDAADSLPFGRLIEVNDVARALCWMASDESGVMTGSIIDFAQAVIGAGRIPRPEPGEYGTE